MESKKYRLIKSDQVTDRGTPLYQIQALIDIPEFGVKAGDLGGFVESELNLNNDIYDPSWIADDSSVSGTVQVCSFNGSPSIIRRHSDIYMNLGFIRGSSIECCSIESDKCIIENSSLTNTNVETAELTVRASTCKNSAIYADRAEPRSIRVVISSSSIAKLSRISGNSTVTESTIWNTMIKDSYVNNSVLNNVAVDDSTILLSDIAKCGMKKVIRDSIVWRTIGTQTKGIYSSVLGYSDLESIIPYTHEPVQNIVPVFAYRNQALDDDALCDMSTETIYNIAKSWLADDGTENGKLSIEDIAEKILIHKSDMEFDQLLAQEIELAERRQNEEIIHE